MFLGYSTDHEEDVYCMLNLSMLKIKNTCGVICLNKSYGEWKGIKGHSSNEFEFTETLSSDADSDKSSKPKTRKTSNSGNTSSDDSSNNKDKESDNSSNIADQTRAKLSQQAEDNLVGGINCMHINKTTVLAMNDISEWCLVGGEEAYYVNSVTFDDTWNHPEDVRRQAWRDAIKKEINDITKRDLWRMAKKDMYLVSTWKGSRCLNS